MKISILACLLITAPLLAGCAGREQTAPSPAPPRSGDFRMANWGMTREEVTALIPDEAYTISSSPDELVVRELLLDRFRAHASYHFVDGKLRRGRYRLEEPGEAIEYAIFRIVLGEKYGPPHGETSAPGMLETVWLTPRTEIDLSGAGPGLEEFSLQHPARSRGRGLEELRLNYYDRSWFARERKKTEKTLAALHESRDLYQELIGNWVEVFPGYQGWAERSLLFGPEHTFIYDPVHFDDF